MSLPLTSSLLVLKELYLRVRLLHSAEAKSDKNESIMLSFIFRVINATGCSSPELQRITGAISGIIYSWASQNMKFCFFAAHLCMQTASEVFWELLRVNVKRFALNSISRRKGFGIIGVWKSRQ